MDPTLAQQQQPPQPTAPADPSASAGMTPAEPERAAVIDAYGNWGTVPQHRLADATQNGGFRIPTADELRSKALEEKYGEGGLNSLKAAGLGALGSATFGLGTLAATKSGMINPDAARVLEKFHPAATFAGEAAGVLGLLFGGPEAAVAKGAVETGETAAKVAPKLAELLNPVKGAAKLGDLSSEASKPLIKKAVGILADPAKRPLVNKILNEAAASGVGSATEGALYGAGQSINEYALGDPNLNAERVMGNIGYGALFGGVLGSTLRAGELAIPPALDAARESLGKMYRVAKGIPEEAYIKGSSMVSGKPEEIIREVVQNRAKLLGEPGELVEKTGELADELNEYHSNVNQAWRQTGKDVRPEETDNLLAGHDPVAAEGKFHETLGTINDAISTLKSDPALYPPVYARQMEDLRDSVAKRFKPGGTASDAFQAIDDLKRQLDTKIKYGKVASPGDQLAKDVLDQVRRGVKQGLEDESVWGPAAARQAAYNSAQADVLQLVGRAGKPGEFAKAFMKTSISRGGKPYLEMDPKKVQTFLRQIGSTDGEIKQELLKDYLEKTSNLTDQIEKTYQSVPSKTFDRSELTNLLQKSQGATKSAMDVADFKKKANLLSAGAHNVPLAEAGSFAVAAHVDPALGAAMEMWHMAKDPVIAMKRLATVEKLVSKTSDKILRGAKAIFKASGKMGEPAAGFLGSRLHQDDKKLDLKKVSKQLHELNSDPERMIEHLQDQTQELFTVAPDTAGSLQQAASRAHSFLLSKLPQPPAPLPLSEPFSPSPMELDQFEHYYQLVEHPMDVLDEVKEGTITPQSMEAIQAVYPQLYQEMKGAITEQLVNHTAKKHEIPYRTKMSLALFLGQPLDHSMLQQNIAFNQMSFSGGGQAQMNSQNNAPVRTSQKGLGSITQADRLMTPLQSTAARERA